jgi:hypothetical protein
VKTRQQTSNLPGFDNVNVRRRIETVTFKFTSRDQGWGGELGLTCMLPSLESVNTF